MLLAGDTKFGDFISVIDSSFLDPSADFVMLILDFY